MAIFSFPCLAFLVAYSVALTTPNISTTLAHVVDQELTTDLPLIQPPNQGNQAQAVQRNEVGLKGQPTATELLSENSPCAQGFGRQMPYYPMAPPGPAGVPGPSGTGGIPGLPGASGAQGARGERGDRGEHGLSGPQGFKGDKGEPGTVGPQGLDGEPGFNGTVYRKPDQYESYATKIEKTKSTKSRSREKEKKSGGFEKVDLATLHAQDHQMPGDPLIDTSVIPKLSGGFKPVQVPKKNNTNNTSQEMVQAHKQGARRKQKFVALYTQEGEARTVVHLPGRHVCECQAAKHNLIANCMRCGRVVCAQEGSGPCLFCGALVCTSEEQEILARNSNKSEKLRKKLLGEQVYSSNNVLPNSKARQDQGLERAMAHKDKLLEYDKTSVRRTQVIDDESDYFAVDTNRWLSDHEREALKKRKDELHGQKHASRLDKKFTLDFAGRRVFEDGSDNVNMYDRNDAVVQAVNFGNPTSRQQAGGDVNPLINPTITQPAPKFVLDKRGKAPSRRGLNSSTGQSSSQGQRIVRIQDREMLEMSDEGMCLSMHQPWATLLTTGIKIHEGRTWYSPHRGRLWISAASKQPSDDEISEVENLHRLFHKGEDIEFPSQYPIGCLLGCIDMVDCLSQEQYRDQFPDGESASPYVFICENPQELVVRFPIKGKHKIWRLDAQVHKAAKKGLRSVKH